MSLAQVWEKAEAYNKQVQVQQLRVQGSEEEIKDAKRNVCLIYLQRAFMQGLVTCRFLKTGYLNHPSNCRYFMTTIKLVQMLT